MGSAIRITREHLLGVVSRLPPQIALRDTDRTYFVALGVLKLFFGPQWVQQNLDPDRGSGFLTQPFGEEAAMGMQSYRVIDLAELIFNLQGVDGFDNCIQQMLDGDVESAYAELDFGRMLQMHGQSFRYITRSGKKGEDYDIEIVATDGLVICADAKCKVQANEFSPTSLRNTLNHARTQFPSDKPSAVFVKIPPHWLSSLERGAEILDVARKFLRGTKRVVSVKIYVDHLVYENGVITHNQAFKEISNPSNRFDPERDWNMFSRDTKGGPVPASWIRLINFPKDPNGLRPNVKG